MIMCYFVCVYLIEHLHKKTKNACQWLPWRRVTERELVVFVFCTIYMLTTSQRHRSLQFSQAIERKESPGEM